MNRRNFLETITKGGTVVALVGGTAINLHGENNLSRKLEKGEQFPIQSTLLASAFFNVSSEYNIGTAAIHDAAFSDNPKQYNKVINYSIKKLTDILDFMNGKGEVFEEENWQQSFDLPFRLAYYAAGNSPIVESYSVKGNKKHHAREFWVDSKGEPTIGLYHGYKFIEMPPNPKINDHLILQGRHKIRSKDRWFEAFHDLSDPFNSKIKNTDFKLYETMNTIRNIMETYRNNICANIESKITELKRGLI